MRANPEAALRRAALASAGVLALNGAVPAGLLIGAVPAGLFIGAVPVGLLIGAVPARAQTGLTSASSAAAERRLRVVHQQLVARVELARSSCVSSAASSQSFSVRALLQKLAFWRTAPTIDFNMSSTDYVGAARDLPAALQRVENVAIRKCMQDDISPVLSLYDEALRAFIKGDAPDLVSVRFAYRQQASAPAYSKNLLISTYQGAPLVKKNLAVNDDAVEGNYYEQEFVVGHVEGVLVPRSQDSAIVGATPPQTRFCFDRPPAAPLGRAAYDRLVCAEGGRCAAHPQSAGHFRICPVVASAADGLLRLTAWQPGGAGATMADTMHWAVPSLATLTEKSAVPGGYTLFHLATDAFRGSGASAVEFALTVNGVPVREDGLTPDLQPVALDGDGRFEHDFALQQLNFRGAHSGCEAIDLGLTPVFSNGRRGDVRRARLRYVLLRDNAANDVALGNVAAGGAALNWSATTIRPGANERNFIIVHSYTYKPGDDAARRRAATEAEQDRLWVDGLGLRYGAENVPVIAAVRPPVQLDPRGLAAYGLILGVARPSGQVRISWSAAEARAIGDYVGGHLPAGARSRQVFGAKPYAKAAPAGAYSLPNVCAPDTVDMEAPGDAHGRIAAAPGGRAISGGQ